VGREMVGWRGVDIEDWEEKGKICGIKWKSRYAKGRLEHESSGSGWMREAAHGTASWLALQLSMLRWDTEQVAL
jgi:hypothetical protein